MFDTALLSRLKLSSKPEEGCRKDSWQSDRFTLSCSHYNVVSRFPYTSSSKVQTQREMSSRDVHKVLCRSLAC